MNELMLPLHGYIWDDPVVFTPQLTREKVRELWENLNTGPSTDYSRGGAYRNRFGELVTWDATADGRIVVMQTWPGE